jgi:hypothetical protein
MSYQLSAISGAVSLFVFDCEGSDHYFWSWGSWGSWGVLEAVEVIEILEGLEILELHRLELWGSAAPPPSPDRHHHPTLSSFCSDS